MFKKLKPEARELLTVLLQTRQVYCDSQGKQNLHGYFHYITSHVRRIKHFTFPLQLSVILGRKLPNSNLKDVQTCHNHFHVLYSPCSKQARHGVPNDQLPLST